MYRSILQLFPKEMRAVFEIVASRVGQVNEIRLRAGKPVLILENGREFFLDKSGKYINTREGALCLDKEVLEKIVQHICHYSLYAFEEEVRQGYITVAGGHRIGMVGQVVLDGEGKIKTMKYICGLNIRISHQVKGVADAILPELYHNGHPKSVLIVSAPGGGKTTLLRDIVRSLSNGSAYGSGVSVGVVDERSEIGGSYLGQPQNDVGIRTDILDACPKVLGMMMLLRSMSPKVIAIDELGSEEDLEAVRVAAVSGCKMVATMHGDSMEDILHRKQMKEALDEGLFETVLLLGKEKSRYMVRQIYERTEERKWICLR